MTTFRILGAAERSARMEVGKRVNLTSERSRNPATVFLLATPLSSRIGSQSLPQGNLQCIAGSTCTFELLNCSCRAEKIDLIRPLNSNGAHESQQPRKLRKYPSSAPRQRSTAPEIEPLENGEVVEGLEESTVTFVGPLIVYQGHRDRRQSRGNRKGDIPGKDERQR